MTRTNHARDRPSSWGCPTPNRFPTIQNLFANCNIKLSISSVRISQVTARCGLGEEGAVGDRRGQAGRAGQAA